MPRLIGPRMRNRAFFSKRRSTSMRRGYGVMPFAPPFYGSRRLARRMIPQLAAQAGRARTARRAGLYRRASVFRQAAAVARLRSRRR